MHMGVCHCFCPMQSKCMRPHEDEVHYGKRDFFVVNNTRTRSSRYELFLCSCSFLGPRSYTRYRVHPCMQEFNLVAPLIHRLFAPILYYIYGTV